MTLKKGDIVRNLLPGEDAEILDVRPSGAGRLRISCVGLNSGERKRLLRTEAQLAQLEIIANTETFDFSGDPTEFKLFAEAERIASAYRFDPLFAVNCSVVDALPHQVEAVYKFLLPQPRIRFLLADDTGAGKTIMTGLLLKELIMRGNADRILIVTPGGLTKQWQEDEMGAKFNLDFKLVNRAVFAAETNVFQTAPRIVTSVDFIHREDVLNALLQARWDIVVFDEAHKLSAYEYGKKTKKSRRYEAAEKLSERCEHLLLLTATPHRGREDSFRRLMQLLDKDIFSSDEVTAARVREAPGENRFFLRRLKESMRDWNGDNLYKKRSTKTVSYELSGDEMTLYEAVTDYLTPQKQKAEETKNRQVTLALQVVQRRLASSVFAVRSTLKKRADALKTLADQLTRNPALLDSKPRLDDWADIETLDDLDDLDDADRDALDDIMTDPQKMRLFTTAVSVDDVRREAAEVRRLYKMADNLFCSYSGGNAEQKFLELQKLLNDDSVIHGEKLVIFTEYTDTLAYLRERLSNNGYTVAFIHGGMSVDERREAQCLFASDQAQILICTDAAGEGINLQFCRLLINWDIPWNPNRLEQRMGRIHRYGQKSDVIVSNMVAGNTREGAVLKKLLSKLDIIRAQLGNDRVYDVIQDVFKDISLEEIIAAVMDGRENELTDFLARNDSELKQIFENTIAERDARNGAPAAVDYSRARRLKQQSDSRRLQPLYIHEFFDKAFTRLGGKYEKIAEDTFRITALPQDLADALRDSHNLSAGGINGALFFFDKQRYLDFRFANPAFGKAHYIDPGSTLFDTLVDVVCKKFRSAALRGTLLADPAATEPDFAFLVKTQITDARRRAPAAVQLSLVLGSDKDSFSETSPARLIDFADPAAFPQLAPELPADAVPADAVRDWADENLAIPLCSETQNHADAELAKRREYIETAFSELTVPVSTKINELQGKDIRGRLTEKDRQRLEERTRELDDIRRRRKTRLAAPDLAAPEFQIEAPEVLGCAYIVPAKNAVPADPADTADTAANEKNSPAAADDDENLSAEAKKHTERVAMELVIALEKAAGRTPEDVSAQNLGYDIESRAADGSRRCIEVKGRAHTGNIVLTPNEKLRLGQLGNEAWLCVVFHCAARPEIVATVQNPVAALASALTPIVSQFRLNAEDLLRLAKNPLIAAK